jgi:hypothetical protein
MIRTPLIAAVTVALLGGTALAAPAGAPPAPLSGSDSARSAPDYDDYDDEDVPPPADARVQPPANDQQARAERDMFCRRDAAARTGYTTPGEAARDEQARGSIGGAVGGAVLGAIIGGAGGNAGSGAAIGAGAGLLAGTAVGASNARQAARDTEAAYSDAYYACMNEAQGPAPAYAEGYGPPPPPAYYPPPPPPVYYGYPYYPYYYGPSVSFGFGFGGYHGHHGWHGGWRHHR